MDKPVSNFNFQTMEYALYTIRENHAMTSTLKSELNKFFPKVKCIDVLYTENTDKLFFGMRVYPVINSEDIVDVLKDDKPLIINGYYVELDSKLFDPMLNLSERELTAMLLHEVGHIVYDTQTIDEVKKQVDMYLAASDDYLSDKYSKGYKEVLAYAMKDSIIKIGSIFSKVGNYEIIADTFVSACGYGPDLASAFRKISRSSIYLNKNVDNRLIAISWALRLKNEFNTSRLPAIKTLNKAKQLTSSKLEERELTYVSNSLNKMQDPINESIIDDMKNRFSKKINDFKIKGIKAIKADAYEMNVRVRCATTQEDLLYIIRTLNTDIAILKDYLTEDITKEEREDVMKTLQYMYEVRDIAAKQKAVQSDSLIQVVYPEL
jgi:hypothetical protein